MEPLRTNVTLPLISVAPAEAEEGLIVVGVGAGVGDLDALLHLLSVAPNIDGMCFVLIHRYERSDDIIALLERRVSTPVVEIADDMLLRSNHIYVAPADVYVGLRHAAFRVEPRDPSHKLGSPFDYFLGALASEYGVRSIAVILSGMSDDTDAGSSTVSERGCLVVSQDHCRLGNNGPSHRTDAGCAADLVLPVERIPDLLLWLSVANKRRGLGPSAVGTHPLAQIFRHLSGTTRRNIQSYKDAILLRRVFRRMTTLGITDLTRYLGSLKGPSDELHLLAKDMLIHVTSFFRDPISYDFLAKTVIPKLVRQHPRTDPIRIWVAGCSTGEEAYSIAILFFEEILRTKRDLKLQIFASDASEEAIARGRAGFYSHSIRHQVSGPRLRRFFSKEAEGYRVIPRLRESILFTVHDLMTDAPFSRLDMVICRNVLIYMRREIQETILSLFHFGLRERGIFFVGVADTIGAYGSGFKPVSYAHRIFERTGGQQRRPLLLPLRRTMEGSQIMPARLEREISTTVLRETTQQLLLQTYAPASIMVNHRYEILDYTGPIERYLKIRHPEAGCELASVLQDGVLPNVQAALRRAVHQGGASTLLGAKVERDGRSVSVVISAQPVPIDDKELLLVTFSDKSDEQCGDQLAPAEEQQSLLNIQLEEELVSTRKRLEITIRDLELANEELLIANQEAMSVNEELQSMNEELEASKEEMQSLNEELMILNQQLQDTAEQQRNSAIDLRNILNSSDVATLFLDGKFNIRFFTPPAKALFGLIASDLGRPLADLARRFTDDRLLDNARSVLANLLPSKREILTEDGHWYLRKITPYRTDEGRAEGVVITFADITEVKLVERDIRAAHAFAESVVETVREPLIVLDKMLAVSVVNKALRDLFGADARQFIGLALADTPARQLAPLMQNILDAERDGYGHVENYRIEIDIPSRGRLTLRMTTRGIGGNTSAAGMILLVLEDVTEKERVEHGLMAAKEGSEQANLIKSQFLAAASHDLRQPLQSLRLLSAILQRKLDDEEALKLNAKCGETIDSMIGVVNAILDINQLEAGAIRPIMQSFPANMLLNKLHSEFNVLVQAKGLRWWVASCNRNLRSDPRLLMQILRNLVNNAIKFTASGKLVVGCRRRGDKVSLEVWDSGPGIPDADIEKMFDFFHKGEATPPGTDEGLGLGLAIVRNLSEILGHEIKVVSHVGKGSCFSVLVPIGAQSNGDPVALDGGHRAVARQRGVRILVVEDEPCVRESLELLFADEGHFIASATSGGEAVRLVSYGTFRPEIIVVDYSIPGGMSGLDVIDEVRAILGQQIPAVVLTGDISSATFAKIATRSAIHLAKPVRADELLDTIHRLQTRTPPARPISPPGSELDTPADSASAETIVVVDDDACVRDSIQQLLESYGHRVATYASGQLFIDSKGANSGRCLILDARMPSMDGFAVLANITKRGIHPPAIMITGHGDVQTAVRAMKAGAFDFIEKPVDADALRASVERALRAATNSQDHISQCATAARNVARLSKRQRAVMDLVVSGHANKVIANRLGIGQRTVESHRAAVMKKLGAKTFADLIRFALAAPQSPDTN
ncbi:Protein-glutamate methylesterase [Methylocella tundrae]|uniref:histidine kinase n=1 Tax=Methylocella tundrae TaxID=227605 RepID=A0A4U8Z201_METTU|nr:Protein-glutamate methylesterase [Methylocella tundrae]